jgi:flagellar protein FliJ
MSPFNFSLQKLLNLRAWKEREQAVAVANARDAAARAAAVESALTQSHLNGMAACAQSQVRGTSAGAMLNMWNAVQGMGMQITHAQQARANAENHLEERMTALRTALTERRALDKLRDVQLRNWKEDASREDQKLMDSIATEKFIRKGEDTHKKNAS